MKKYNNQPKFNNSPDEESLELSNINSSPAYDHYMESHDNFHINLVNFIVIICMIFGVIALFEYDYKRYVSSKIDIPIPFNVSVLTNDTTVINFTRNTFS